MIGKLLGHILIQTTARYAHLATAPKKCCSYSVLRDCPFDMPILSFMGVLVRDCAQRISRFLPAQRSEPTCVIFPISRLVCDVERFPSDPDEPMATRGMGVIYTRTLMGEVLRTEPGAADRQSLLDRWYRPPRIS
jgi:hypothetical protein